jgi:hypothetical protein
MFLRRQVTTLGFLGHVRLLGGIFKYCSIIYRMVFGKLAKISVFKTEVLQIL